MLTFLANGPLVVNDFSPLSIGLFLNFNYLISGKTNPILAPSTSSLRLNNPLLLYCFSIKLIVTPSSINLLLGSVTALSLRTAFASREVLVWK